MICDCGGVLQPVQLDAFDMSAFVGHPVPTIRTPGYRCDGCQGATVDGHILNAYMAGFNAGTGPKGASRAELVASVQNLNRMLEAISFPGPKSIPIRELSDVIREARALIARAGGYIREARALIARAGV